VAVGGGEAAGGKRGRFPQEIWSDLGEEFRTLRTQVRAALGEGQRLLLVTSSVPQEGKSTVAALLSRALAAAGRRVLLVDVDLRRPELHNVFRTQRAGGLSEVARGALSLDGAAAATDVENLSLLTAGTPVSSPAEFIDSEAFAAVLLQARERYDAVVLDSPPLLTIADSQLLARHADGILFVVRGFQTPREMVKSALERLQGRPVLGVVLNGISTPRRYGYYY